MIIRRQLHSENKLEVYDDGMEFRPIYKKAPQTNSSAGTSTARDVDDLLKPIQRPKHNDDTNIQQSQLSKERTERNLWRNDEIIEMLYTMQQVKALEKLNDKTVKSENVFKDVEVIMNRNGFVKKSHVQIWTKWKFLKSTYMTSRRNGVIPRMVPPQIYEMIHQMITGLNQSLADSCSSADGDNSIGSGMVISGVEGGVSNVGVTNGDDEDSFGMAHPIFGFRLGMVKSEPEDTGYEPAENSDSDKDPLEEELPLSKLDKKIKDHNNTESKTIKEPEPVQKVLEIPHRGRGRPPKNPPTLTSTPNNTPSPASKPAQMPPLRVAPFAKVIHTENNSAANRPPPPLTIPPKARIRVANLSDLKSGDHTKFAQPKLTPKPIQQQHSAPVQSVRISKEITQSRSSSTPSPSYPKMKQIPMRKTPYSLRPDRAIPDLEASLSPPPSAVEKPSNKKLEEVPTTKHLVMQSNSNNFQNNANRKRRNDWQDPPPDKQPKYNNTSVDDERNYSNSDNTDYDKNYGKVLQNVIIDLSSSLRKMQTEMMRDFFNKQNELLEREHKFQIQQDHMIMKAFQEQTQEIMHSVKQLVGSIKTYKNVQQNDSRENVKEAKLKNQRQQIHAQKLEREIDDDQDEENEIVDEEQSQDQEDLYTSTDGEEDQDDQMEEHDENDQEEIENNIDEEENEESEQLEEEDHSKITKEQNKNGLAVKNN